MKNLKLLFLFSAFLLFTVKCKKAFTSKNCDPQKKFEASFKIGYNFLNGRFVESDTLINFSAWFEADTTYTYYEWQIGNRIYNTQKLHLVFPQSALGQKIPVRLIAKGEKNTCNSYDTGIDTVEREVVLLYSKELKEANDYNYEERHLVELSFFGKWHGYFEDMPNDTFTVTINNNGKAPSAFTDRFYNFRIYNLPKGCSVKQENGVTTCEPVIDTIQKYYGYKIEEVSYNSFYVSTQDFVCCPSVEMFGIVNRAKNIITIECDFYSYTNNGVTKKTRIFKGIKT